MTTDILVIGGGIAGLSFAARAAKQFPGLQIILLTKDDCIESNTRYAQGGIAIALDTIRDSFGKHIEDTMIAGAGLCDPEVVEMVVSEGPDRLLDLIEWGVGFDRDADGQLVLGCEGGHTAHRVIHCKDATGFHIADALLRYVSGLPNVLIYDHHLAVDLITRPGLNSLSSCSGVMAIDLNGGVAETISARVTILATGGAGQVYATTTNPLIATGDGIAMAWRAGAEVRDMEFVQFHPTAFYSENENPSFLISEALRGFGAFLRNETDERFVFKHDPRGELASRDIVSYAIHEELVSKNQNFVYLDCRHLNPQDVISHFPTIYQQCLRRGFDLTRDLIPVAPAAHYVCGGIAVGLSGRTSIENLYACGECSRTGLHGANRLASNSLLEALVFANQILLDLEECITSIPIPEPLAYCIPCAYSLSRDPDLEFLRSRIRERMSKNVGIVKSYDRLADTHAFLMEVRQSLAEMFWHRSLSLSLIELRNLVDVALLIVDHSVRRKENRGTYFNKDLLTHA
jgi:L-aspartate oxidase